MPLSRSTSASADTWVSSCTMTMMKGHEGDKEWISD
jgi:hypothetical protein